MTSLYQFQTADYLVGGNQSIEKLAELLKERVTDLSTVLVVSQVGLIELGLLDSVYKQLEQEGIRAITISSILPEPTVKSIQALADEYASESFDYIVAVGGGSVLDAAKLLSVLHTNNVTVQQLLDGQQATVEGIPTAMVPTTAGTGSEVTPNAIVTIPDQELKVGIVSRFFLPALVILDPSLTTGLPKPFTAATGMDAFTHAFESYISNKANMFSDVFALESIRLISDSIVESYENGSSIEAREKMLMGSMYGGMALTSAGTAAVHALAYPLGGKFNIPHGVANSMLLPHVTSFNLDSMMERLPAVAKAMSIHEEGDTLEQTADKIIAQIEEWIRVLNIPQDLKEFGVTDGDITHLAEAAIKIKRLLDNNPKSLTVLEIENLYKKLL
ncbi:iron-containing alcohol dehydrogenase [Sporosarcina cascadiensis]|uniref:iron-containing alcohol dehydrogenase n=1 Tax=Sporosarcina cascadiensis TaxID=2660747 RepID=UPI00129B79B5|nr:iron-containing alcohol dehydrogenase [Sporosarcina cascadiensis]